MFWMDRMNGAEGNRTIETKDDNQEYNELGDGVYDDVEEEEEEEEYASSQEESMDEEVDVCKEEKQLKRMASARSVRVPYNHRTKEQHGGRKAELDAKPRASMNYDISNEDNEVDIYDDYEEEDDDDDNDDDKEEERYYAVRKGKSTTACIFLFWEDCWEQIGGFEDAEYEGFLEFEAAVEYVRFAKLEEKAKAKAKQQNNNNSNNSKRRDCTTDAKIHSEKEANPRIMRQQQDNNNNNNNNKPAQQKPPVTKSSMEWNRMYDELLRYKEENGNCLVKNSSDTELSEWVTLQRQQYKKLQKCTPSAMTRERFDKLAEIGFEFNPYEATGEQNKTNGSQPQQNVKPSSPLSSSPSVAAATASVSAPEKDRSNRKYLTWEMRFEDLKQYKDEHGNCNVPKDHGSLGRWVRSMRYQMKKHSKGEHVSSLSAKRVAMLQSIDFDVNTTKSYNKRGPSTPASSSSSTTKKSTPKELAEASASNWEEMYQQLRQYWVTNGTCMVKCLPYTPLRGWMVKQREQYHLLREGKPSTMTADRIQRLNDIDFPFISTTKNLTWEERYEQLKEYKDRYGHVVVPRYSTDYVGLGKWVQRQRAKYKDKSEGRYSNLTDERIRLLEELGMAWSVLKQCKDRAERLPWSTRFEQLLQFKKEHGHTVVPQHYPELGNWVHQQRTHYKLMRRGKDSLMNHTKALQLAEIGFVFQVKGRKPKAAIKEQQLQNNPPKLPPFNNTGECWTDEVNFPLPDMI